MSSSPIGRGQTPAIASRELGRRHRGAALLIAMILLTLIALAVLSAYSLSASNFLVVGNVQRSEEAQAAGMRSVEASISSQIKALPALVEGAPSPPAWPVVDTRNEDVDGDGNSDFEVSLARFRCLESVLLTDAPQSGTSTSVTLTGNWTPFVAYDTLWEFEADVRDLRGDGSRLTVVVGVRVQLTKAQWDAYCPAPP